jgi:hypothetical protein
LAVIAVREGAFDDADAQADRCLEHARLAGNPSLAAQAGVIRGESAQARGDLEAAERWYLAARRRVGSESESVVELTIDVSLALLALRMDRLPEARRQLVDVLERVAGRWGVLDAVVRIALATCEAALQELDAVEEGWARGRQGVVESGYVDPDVAYLAARFADQVRDWRPDLAEQAEALAEAQREVLGAAGSRR